MCLPDQKTLTGATVSPQSRTSGLPSPFPQQTYKPPAPISQSQQKQQAGFQDVLAPQLGTPGAPPLFAPRIERAASTVQTYATDAAGVKRAATTGYRALQINRQ